MAPHWPNASLRMQVAFSFFSISPNKISTKSTPNSAARQSAADPSLQRAATCIPILGDIRDAALLDDVFQKYRPTIILHAAAFKHVPLMEQNPIAVIANNVLGTSVLAAALKYRARQLLMISTDKAVRPRSIMGAAKRIAELILLRQSSAATHMSSLRLGNVLGSNGSVVPLFHQQIERGGPVSVTHPDASRYFLPLDEAIDLILSAAALDESSSILVPELGAPVKILDLAQKMIAEAAVTASSTRVGICAAGASTVSDRPAKIEIAFTGLRPGDKLHEELLSDSETAEPTANPKLCRIRGPHLSAKNVDSAVELISEKVTARDLPAAIEAIQVVVPDYVPSEALSSLIATQLSAAAKP